MRSCGSKRRRPALANLRLQLQNEYLQQEAATLAMESDYQKAALQAEVNQQLADKALLAASRSSSRSWMPQQLAARLALAKKQLAEPRPIDDGTHRRCSRPRSIRSRAIVQLKQRQVDELRVRAGVAGVLQVVPVEVGQQVAPGRQPRARRRSVPGSRRSSRSRRRRPRTSRSARWRRSTRATASRRARSSAIDPSVQNGTVTVDVALDGALPKGARPDLSVDGTIELERLDDVLFVGRPAFGQEQSTVGLSSFSRTARPRACR